MISSSEKRDWRRLFEGISVPRLAGSRSCDETVTKLADLLKREGYRVRLQHFVAGPERLVGGSLFGLLLTIGSLVTAGMLVLGPKGAWPPHLALVVTVSTTAVVLFTALALLAGLRAAAAAHTVNGCLFTLLSIAGVVAALILLHGPVSAGPPDGPVAPAMSALRQVLHAVSATVVAVYPRARALLAGFALVAGLPAAVGLHVASGGAHARWIVKLLGYRLPPDSGGREVCQVHAANITAVKSPDPRVWLVAHSDSKVQRHSLATRMVAVTLAAIGAFLLVASATLITPVPRGIVLWIGIVPGLVLTLVGGTLLAFAGLADGSPGAVDNATGVVAVLAAAEQLGWREEVGILITGAEELAMAGAREWVKKGWRGTPFVNFDGVDGRGRYRIWLHQGAAPGVARTLARRLRHVLGAGEARIARRLNFGMFVDGSILAKAGFVGVTVQRGTFAGTAAVAHTRFDTPARVDLAGAVRAGHAAAAVIEEVLDRRP